MEKITWLDRFHEFLDMLSPKEIDDFYGICSSIRGPDVFYDNGKHGYNDEALDLKSAVGPIRGRFFGKYAKHISGYVCEDFEKDEFGNLPKIRKDYFRVYFKWSKQIRYHWWKHGIKGFWQNILCKYIKRYRKFNLEHFSGHRLQAENILRRLGKNPYKIDSECDRC